MSLQANNITYYDSWDIPQYVKPNPNLATLNIISLKIIIYLMKMELVNI